MANLDPTSARQLAEHADKLAKKLRAKKEKQRKERRAESVRLQKEIQDLFKQIFAVACEGGKEIEIQEVSTNLVALLEKEGFEVQSTGLKIDSVQQQIDRFNGSFHSELFRSYDLAFAQFCASVLTLNIWTVDKMEVAKRIFPQMFASLENPRSIESGKWVVLQAAWDEWINEFESFHTLPVPRHPISKKKIVDWTLSARSPQHENYEHKLLQSMLNARSVARSNVRKLDVVDDQVEERNRLRNISDKCAFIRWSKAATIGGFEKVTLELPFAARFLNWLTNKEGSTLIQEIQQHIEITAADGTRHLVVSVSEDKSGTQFQLGSRSDRKSFAGTVKDFLNLLSYSGFNAKMGRAKKGETLINIKW